MYDVINKKISDLTPDEYKQCYRLNLGKNGQMRTDLIWCETHPDNVTVLMVKPGNTLIAWALILPEFKDMAAHFYVRSNYRRKGIGTQLAIEANRIYEKPVVFGHDEVSHMFFKAVDNLVESC